MSIERIFPRAAAIVLLGVALPSWALTPQETERLQESVRVTAGRLHLETNKLYYSCWLIDCEEYRGKKGVVALAKAHAEVRKEFVDWAKHEISYWKDVPDAVASFKRAFEVGLEFMDTPPPHSSADRRAWEERLRVLLEKFDEQMAKAQAALELAGK